MNKKLLLCSVFSAALLLGAGIVNAQDRAIENSDRIRFARMQDGPNGVHGRYKSNELETKLNLTEEQKRKAKEIREQGQAELTPLIEEMKNTRKKIDEIRTTNMNEFKAILTDEQKAKLEEIKKEMDEQIKEFRQKGRGMLPPHGEDGMLPPPPPHGDILGAPEGK